MSRQFSFWLQMMFFKNWIRPVVFRLECLLFVVFVGLTVSAAAQPTYRSLVDYQFDFAEDRSLILRGRLEYTPLVQAMVQPLSQFSFPVESNQSFEIEEAFTRKANGDVVKVQPSDIVVQKGAVEQMRAIADIALHRVSFRSIAPGDTIVIKLIYREKEHYIPGAYSRRLASVAANSEQLFNIQLRAPRDMPLHFSAPGYEHSQSLENDRVVHRWSASAQRKAMTEKNVPDADSYGPRLFFSTFGSYDELGNAYAAMIGGPTPGDPQISALAQKITAGKNGDREKAQAIFDWVAARIHYVAIYLGNGGYMPNPPAKVLERGFGDCKDHVVLMRALLAAIGVESRPVLISTESDYELPQTAVLSAFNHLIVYIPSLDLYADPTSPYSNLGALPGADAGKPVVIVAKDASKQARTPAAPAQGNVVRMATRIVLAEDFSATGETTTEATGEFAGQLRSFVARSEAMGAESALASLAADIGSQMRPKDMTMDAPSSLDSRPTFKLAIGWKAAPIPLLKSGWGPPPGLSPIDPERSLFIRVQERDHRVFPAQCLPGSLTFDQRIVLPPGVKMRPPPPVSFVTPALKYFDGWMLADGVLSRHMHMVSETDSRVCAPALVNPFIDAAQAASNREGLVFHFTRAN